MNEEHVKRDQTEKLRARFKHTGIVDPTTQVWQPTPTAGDHARALTQDIIDERNAELPEADEAARSFFKSA